MSRVFPGLELVMAKPFRAEIMLIKEDLPTFERPMNAYSGFSEQGQDAKPGQLFTNSAVFMSIVFGFLRLAARRMDFMYPGTSPVMPCPFVRLRSKYNYLWRSNKGFGISILANADMAKTFFSCAGHGDFLIKFAFCCYTPTYKMKDSTYPSLLLENAVNQFARLPGIGRKTAFRLALYVLESDRQFAEDFANAVLTLKNEVKRCRCCKNISDTDLCQICSNPKRDSSIVCVVESVRELMLIENTASFNGLYHVLGGVISPMDGIGPGDLEISSLVQRVEGGGIKEVVFALSTTTEGNTTAYYIARKLAHTGVLLSAVAQGVAVGDELQYADELTLGRSIENRVPYRL